MLQNSLFKPAFIERPLNIEHPLKLFIVISLAIGSLLTLSTTAFATDSTSTTVCETPPLDILLTNDDGFDKPGIRALHQVFKQAGHRVVLAAPAKNASGSSASLTFAPIKVSQSESDVYAIHGSPATTVLLGASAFFPDGPPDLVISGINKGANIGPATPISGTVGATIAAILVSQPSIPAIAISTDPFSQDGYSDDENKQADQDHLNRVSTFVLALVSSLQTQHCDGSALLPPKVALNVNYPPIPHKDIKGVQLQKQGKAPLFSLTYAPSDPSHSDTNPIIYAPRFKILPPILNNDDGDTGAFHEGYITIVPVDGNYTADEVTKGKIAPALLGLKP